MSQETRRKILELSGFFATDALGGGLLVQSIVAFWFFTRFSAPLNLISVIFSVAGVLTAVMFFAAAKLSDVIGSLKTMCFIHIPSDGALMLMPVFPNFLSAMVLYLAFISITQMDVPPRQAYLVSLVKPEELVAAASLTNSSRNLAQIVGPSVSGYLIQFVSLSSPFYVAGVTRLLGAMGLYLRFRKVQTKSSISRQPD